MANIPSMTFLDSIGEENRNRYSGDNPYQQVPEARCQGSSVDFAFNFSGSSREQGHIDHDQEGTQEIGGIHRVVYENPVEEGVVDHVRWRPRAVGVEW